MYRIASWRFHARTWVGAIVALAIAVAAVLSAPVWRWDHVPAVRLDVLGWLVFLAGASFRFWSTLYVGGRKVGGRRELKLVETGPYSVCRNPLYVGTLLAALSAPIMLGSLTLTALVFIGWAFYVLATVPAEEEFLREALGEPYLRYCQRVPRYWPRWSRFHTPRFVEIDVKALANECRRALRWVWAPVLVQFLAAGRLQPWWPNLFWLP